MRILIVDDDASILDVMSFYVRKEGYEPVIARDGVEAIALFRKTSFDLVVLDVMMPGKDGFETLSDIREVDEKVPVIMLSAKGGLEDKGKGFGLGADDYVTKPFETEELMLRVNSCLRRSKARGEPKQNGKIIMGSLSIDARKREVTIRQERKEMTAKEFDLLLHMAEHPNTVFSHRQLLEAVWGANYIGDPGVVKVYVRKLREKIEEDPAAPKHLLTDWGVGYRLV